ncbi:unnamed protein product [Allacma fusca]|uniref:G-protein coupled receptors family 1 profile domain-containing protein n=1 Tax=Allacma fusca TaxID=39272 RepID=A0A8J2KIN0_9HEXA|nr:unnamed protein product [Allacma fusca]
MKIFDPNKQLFTMPTTPHHLRHEHQKHLSRSNISIHRQPTTGTTGWDEIQSHFVLETSESGPTPATTIRSVMENTWVDTSLTKSLDHVDDFSGGSSRTETVPSPIPYGENISSLLNRSNDIQELEGPSSEFQSYMYSIVVPIMLLFCFASALINLVIVLSARWCRKPMSPTLYFSFSLALADAFAATVMGAGLIINSLLPYVYKIHSSNCISLALEAFRLGGVLVTVAHLVALSINYWIGIVRPLQYAATMTRGTAIRVIVLSWICPITTLLLYFSSYPNQGFQSNRCLELEFLFKQTFRLIVAVFFFTPLVLMFGIYSHIFVIVQNHHRYNQRYQSCVQLRRNVKAVITTCLILGTYIVGWMPAILWYILVCEDCVFDITNIPYNVKIPVNIVINILVILKAVVDPIIYALRMTDIQVALKKMRYNFFLWVFEACAAPWSPPKTSMEVGSVGFTKSLRLSSRRSSSRSNV